MVTTACAVQLGHGRVSRGQSPSISLRALTRATTLVAEGLAEERLVPLLARCAAEAVTADICAVYLQPEQPRQRGLSWRLSGQHGADPEVLGALPTSYGRGGGVLAPLFEGAHEVDEGDLLAGAPLGAAVPPPLPVRSLFGVPVRRRDGRPIGVLLVGAVRPNAFEDAAQHAIRSIGQLIGIGIDSGRLAAGQQRERRIAAESAVTLGTVLESVSTGVCVVELDGTLRVANKVFQDMFDVSGRSTGVSQADVFATSSAKPREWDDFVARLRELNADPAQIDQSEWELTTETPRIVQRYSAPMRSLAGEVVGRVEVYTDVTESRRLYAQLLNSEKLRVVGEMAAGVAHQFNNYLGIILGQAELLRPDDMPPTTQLAITAIRKAALSGASVVRNIQVLARPRVETPSTGTELNEAVQAAVEMARPRLAGLALHGHSPVHVRLTLADPTTLARVAIDPAELREVLINLLFNAADAMPEGGRIEITTRIGRERNTADLEVRDTGQGMPESVRAHIFEPFFSTKGTKGSGLGLAVAYSIITRHGGKIDVASRLGEGTIFSIRLPYAPLPPTTAGAEASPDSEARAIPSQVSPSAGYRLRGARILVVDDEPSLVAIVRQLMERSGATVMTALGGKAALEAVHAPDAHFDVVITDLDMPEVDGWAVAAEVKARAPATYVVMMTGWAGEIAPEDFKKKKVDVVLAKPCGRVELETAIGALLAPQPATGLNILLVDDEAAFARAIQALLGLQGHHVTVVDSAAKALAVIESSSRVDVVLTDYSLGEVTGAELAERLVDRPSPPYVILITGLAIKIDDPTLFSRGVSAVLPKPCRGDDLRQVLARVRVPVTSASG